MNTILQLSTPYTEPERQKTARRIGLMIVGKSFIKTNSLETGIKFKFRAV